MKEFFQWLLYERVLSVTFIWKSSFSDFYMKEFFQWLLYERVLSVTFIWKSSFSDFYMKEFIQWLLYERVHSVTFIWKSSFSDFYMKEFFLNIFYQSNFSFLGARSCGLLLAPVGSCYQGWLPPFGGQAPHHPLGERQVRREEGSRLWPCLPREGHGHSSPQTTGYYHQTHVCHTS